MIRRYGDTRIDGIPYRARPGAYAILPRDGSLLVTYQKGPEGEFQLPGGGIDFGESPMAALHREVLEETGWRISSARFYTAFRRFVFMPDYDMWAEKICRIYIARPVRQISAPIEPDHDARWLSPKDAARHLGNPGDRACIQSLL